MPHRTCLLVAAIALMTTACAAAEMASVDPPPQSADKPPEPGLAIDAPPEGFMTAEVITVISTPEGNAVVLSDEEHRSLLPIFVGPTEAMSIQLRLERRRYVRPLTHDLLEEILDQMGGRLLKVHIDGLKSGVFVGTVFIGDGDKVYQVDARPSDAIALAVGRRVPIYLANEVMEKAGIPHGNFGGAEAKPESTPRSRPSSEQKAPPGSL